MRLGDYLDAQDAAAANLPALRDRLRGALYQRLSVETIAAFAREDAARAKREVRAALQLELRQPAFSDVSTAVAERLLREVADMAVGLGPLEPLLADPSITEIMVNGAGHVFFEREGRLHRSMETFPDDATLRAVIERIVAPLGRRVDEQSPIVAARLPDGSRVNVVLPPLAIDGPALNIRRFRERVFTLEELVGLGSLSQPLAQLLRWAVRARKNIAVSGGTGSGKTTLLNALSVEIDPAERIVTIEDSAELRFSQHPHVVRLEARANNAEGQGQVTIRDLVTASLRMRPDRIVVGECRNAEALDMLQSMNTGHEGSMTTLHASSPLEVISRLIMMSRYGVDLPVDVIEEQIASALDLIVQLDRFADGRRRLTSCVSVGADASGRKVVLMPIVSWDRRQSAYGSFSIPPWVDDLETLGVARHGEVETWKSQVC